MRNTTFYDESYRGGDTMDVWKEKGWIKEGNDITKYSTTASKIFYWIVDTILMLSTIYIFKVKHVTSWMVMEKESLLLWTWISPLKMNLVKIWFINSGTLNGRKRIQKVFICTYTVLLSLFLLLFFCFCFVLRRPLFNILHFGKKALCVKFVYKLENVHLVVFILTFPLVISQHYEKPDRRLPWVSKYR